MRVKHSPSSKQFNVCPISFYLWHFSLYLLSMYLTTAYFLVLLLLSHFTLLFRLIFIFLWFNLLVFFWLSFFLLVLDFFLRFFDFFLFGFNFLCLRFWNELNIFLLFKFFDWFLNCWSCFFMNWHILLNTYFLLYKLLVLFFKFWIKIVFFLVTPFILSYEFIIIVIFIRLLVFKLMLVLLSWMVNEIVIIVSTKLVFPFCIKVITIWIIITYNLSNFSQVTAIWEIIKAVISIIATFNFLYFPSFKPTATFFSFHLLINISIKRFIIYLHNLIGLNVKLN